MGPLSVRSCALFDLDEFLYEIPGSDLPVYLTMLPEHVAQFVPHEVLVLNHEVVTVLRAQSVHIDQQRLVLVIIGFCVGLLYFGAGFEPELDHVVFESRCRRLGALQGIA